MAKLIKEEKSAEYSKFVESLLNFVYKSKIVNKAIAETWKLGNYEMKRLDTDEIVDVIDDILKQDPLLKRVVKDAVTEARNSVRLVNY